MKQPSFQSKLIALTLTSVVVQDLQLPLPLRFYGSMSTQSSYSVDDLDVYYISFSFLQ